MTLWSPWARSALLCVVPRHNSVSQLPIHPPTTSSGAQKGFKGYISIVSHFHNLHYTCPKMVAKRGNMAIAEQLGSYATILHYYVPLDETWQITKNIINLKANAHIFTKMI